MGHRIASLERAIRRQSSFQGRQCAVGLSGPCDSLLGHHKRLHTRDATNMVLPALQSFISQAAAHARDRSDPADCVLALAPLMLELIERATTFLEPQHYRSDADHYARNLVYEAPDASLSLYTLV